MTIDEVLGLEPVRHQIVPAIWWRSKPLPKDVALASWLAGRDFQMLSTKQYLSINESRNHQDEEFWINTDDGLIQLPNAAAGAEAVYYTPPKRDHEPTRGD